MRHHLIACTLCAALCAACDGNVSGAKLDSVEEQGAELGTPSCPGFSARNSEHVTAGRAYVGTRRLLGRDVPNYYALGTNEDLGRFGTTRTTLYQIAPGTFS